MREKLKYLKWDIRMYRKLLETYKEKEYLPGYFKNCLTIAIKNHNNIIQEEIEAIIKSKESLTDEKIISIVELYIDQLKEKLEKL